jgi:23S rRNA-/tRNA-specific pseudouridylate synthase
MSDETGPPSSIPSFDPRWIIFHGSGVLALNKPAGLPVHRGTDHPFGIAECLDEWVRVNPGVLEIRPGKPVHPVHRLDLEASGVLLLGLHHEAARALQKAFSERLVKKRYLVVVAGPVDAEGYLRGAVRSRLRGIYRRLDAELSYRRLRGDNRLSLLEVIPSGGRSHQIRALFAQSGRPLAGDLRYGKPKPGRQFLEKFEVPYFLLHAREVLLPPGIPGVPRSIEAAIPEEFHKVVLKKGWEPLPASG